MERPLRAEGALRVIVRRAPSPGQVVLAGVGGSEEAMRQILDPDSPWKAEVGLAIKAAAEKSYEVLNQMIGKEVPLRTRQEFLVRSPVFLQPSLEQVRRYLEENHGIREFKVKQ